MAIHTPSPLERVIDDLRESLASLLRSFADFVAPEPAAPNLSRLLERAPMDDEPVTENEREGIERAAAEVARGEVHSLDEIKRELA